MKENSSVKILLVDDRAENLFALDLILSSENYLCMRANSGKEALKILHHEQDLAIILLDVQMPVMDGFKTLEYIRKIENLKHTPVIFLTAGMDAEQVYKGYQTGAVDYIIKPFLPEILKAKVAVFVDLYKKTNELLIQYKEKDKRASELIIANKELVFQNEEKEKRANELIIADKELDFQNIEKGKRAAELIIANKELVFQNVEKGKRAAELIIANKELVFQNREKEKRADELLMANKELAYQNEEKEKRADELSTANKELAFQNEEKEKRAAELIIANKKLVFQNKEKEKRAAELIIANKELTFQNREKEKRADELMIANKELVFQNEEKEKRAAELIIADEEIIIQNKEKEKQVAENKELESFSYSVSHDLRAPLRGIDGFAKILMADYSGLLDAEGIRICNLICDNTKRMGQLIDDLLVFSHLGRSELNKSLVVMKTLVQTVYNEIMESPASERITFIVGDLYTSSCDSNLIRQVWINLISNSIKYSSKKEKPVIEVKCRKENNYCIYSISDNGAGFNMDYYDKLFGVFQRLHCHKEFEGTGIGLASVQRIVNRHAGKVWAEGKEGEGATFHFSLPIVEIESTNDTAF